jgi:hypothetical protein
MTRQQVAKRLGKSLATVRRLEGGRLNPSQDARGVHRFDPDEVEALALDIETGRVALWQELQPVSGDPIGVHRADSCVGCSSLEDQVRRLQAQLEGERAMHRHEVAAHDREARELLEQVAELVATLED